MANMETTLTTDKTTLAILAQSRPASRAPGGYAAGEKVVQVVSKRTYRQVVVSRIERLDMGH